MDGSAPPHDTATLPPPARALASRLAARNATIGVIGLGYVGLPLARLFAESGLSVIGFDIDPDKVAALNAGRSYIRHIPADDIAAMRRDHGFRATSDFAAVADADALLICVPTPLSRNREPDLRYVHGTCESIAPHLRAGQLVVLESTTYPGTTRDILATRLAAADRTIGESLFLAYSPEREDPGNPEHSTARIPKIVGADDPASLALALALYRLAIAEVLPVSSAATAEAVKLTENIFRAVNIALVNELKVIFERMGIDIWEVIEAAKTKPFGYMPFYPGPGLGGHCIPIDPFYLSWKAREFGTTTRFIELAGEINVGMPGYVIDRLAEALDREFGRPLRGARVLILGAAYKKNVEDIRESPALKLITLLRDRLATVAYYDPLVTRLPRTRDYPHLADLHSLTEAQVGEQDFDAALICTDHDGVDYRALLARIPLVVDTRNATRGLDLGATRIVRA